MSAGDPNFVMKLYDEFIEDNEPMDTQYPLNVYRITFNSNCGRRLKVGLLATDTEHAKAKFLKATHHKNVEFLVVELMD